MEQLGTVPEYVKFGSWVHWNPFGSVNVVVTTAGKKTTNKAIVAMLENFYL